MMWHARSSASEFRSSHEEYTAMCRAVQPFASMMSRFAPATTKAWTTGVLQTATAICRVVSPPGVSRSRLANALRTMAKHMLQPSRKPSLPSPSSLHSPAMHSQQTAPNDNLHTGLPGGLRDGVCKHEFIIIITYRIR